MIIQRIHLNHPMSVDDAVKRLQEVAAGATQTNLGTVRAAHAVLQEVDSLRLQRNRLQTQLRSMGADGRPVKNMRAEMTEMTVAFDRLLNVFNQYNVGNVMTLGQASELAVALKMFRKFKYYLPDSAEATS